MIPCPTFRLSDFSQPVSFEQAEIGQCPNLAPPPPPAPLPDEEEPDKEGEELKPTQASTPPEPSAVSDLNMLTHTNFGLISTLKTLGQLAVAFISSKLFKWNLM